MSCHSGLAISIAHSTDGQQQPAPNGNVFNFKTEYHPCRNWLTLYQIADEFHIHKPFTFPADHSHWHPFASEGNFEFAKNALNDSLNQGWVDALLKLIADVASNRVQITLKNEAELHKTCNGAVEELTLVSSSHYPSSHSLQQV